ncbi:hypothetical protein ACFPTO_22085 [Paraburkholderia denitrificans]|uniref:Uncharacterized protein n=1 Tax=Paraburkholderia denitrificans TaxID=694025 RepID=A0ABW0JE46_9BURK
MRDSTPTILIYKRTHKGVGSSYAWSAQVDALLCIADEDPVAGIELDSAHYDTDDSAERDEMKHLLFNLSGAILNTHPRW